MREPEAPPSRPAYTTRYYLAGVVMAALIVGGYALVENGLPSPTPTPMPTAHLVVLPPSQPPAVSPPQIVFGPGVIGTPGPGHFDTLSPLASLSVPVIFPPLPAPLAPSPTPRPTHHVLHSGPPLH